MFQLDLPYHLLSATRRFCIAILRLIILLRLSLQCARTKASRIFSATLASVILRLHR